MGERAGVITAIIRSRFLLQQGTIATLETTPDAFATRQFISFPSFLMCLFSLFVQFGELEILYYYDLAPDLPTVTHLGVPCNSAAVAPPPTNLDIGI